MFNKGKVGHNTNILILQILYALKRGNLSFIEERESSLQTYSYKYLKGEHTKRTRLFLRMLMQISKGYFNKTNVSLKAAEHLKKIEAVPLRWAMQSNEIEIVPYMTLWEKILQLL